MVELLPPRLICTCFDLSLNNNNLYITGPRQLFHNRPLPQLPENNLGEEPRSGSMIPTATSPLPELLESFKSSSAPSTSTSVRTKYGISETEYHDDTQIKFLAENQPSGTEEQDDVTNIAQPVYMFREAIEIRHHVQGGYPNLPAPSVESSSSMQFQAHAEQDPHSSPDIFGFRDSRTEENAEIYYNEIEETEVGNHSSQNAPTGMIPRLEEVIEFRDFCHDGTDDEQERISTHGDENVEVLIMADLILKELCNCNILPSKACHLHIQNDLDFSTTTQAVTKLPEFPGLKVVLLHCGFRHSKKDIPKDLKEDIKEAINIVDEKYSEASIYISAVLPCRGNKNRSKIDEVNLIIEEACNETSAEFVDFTPALASEDTGKIDIKLYSDTLSLNKKGSKKFAEMMMKTLHINPTAHLVRELGIKSREVQIEDKEKERSYSSDAKSDSIADKNEKAAWFKIEPKSTMDFIFSGL